jgi:putative transposase
MLCRALEVHPGGYYAWLHQPLSDREIEDSRLTNKIKQYWLESGGHSGYRNIHEDLLEAKVDCGRDRVLRLMRLAGLRALRGYKAPKGYYSGAVHPAAPNLLDRQFEVEAPNKWWVSDITYSAPSLRKLLWKMLSGLEHVWNASRTTLEETNWMPALCYGRA